MSSPSHRPLLAFGAHPDDIEFGCGAVLALEQGHGRLAHCVIASRGEAATYGTPAERTAEAARAAQHLGASLEFVECGGDAHLAPAVAHALTFAALIRRFRPQWVLAPTTVATQHPDHVVVGQMVRDAARLARYGGVAELREWAPHSIDVLWTYAITSEAEPATPPCLFDVSAPEVVTRWQAAMEAHESQSRSRNYSELQLARARVCGLRAGVERAWPLWPQEPLVLPSLANVPRSARRF